MKILFGSVLLLGNLSPGIQLASAQTWTQTSGPTNSWYSVASSADGRKLVAVAATAWGYSGGIWTSSDSGNTWISNNPSANNWISVASSADGTKLVALGNGIWTSGDSGNTWVSNNVPENYWWSVASSADGIRLAAGTQPSPAGYQPPVIYTSMDSGSTWVSNNIPTNGFYSVALSADGSKLFCAVSSPPPMGGGSGSEFLLSTNLGANWVVEGTQQFGSVACSSDGTKLVAASGWYLGSRRIPGLVWTSTNSGATWTQTGAPQAYWGSVASSADGTRLAAAAGSQLPQPPFIIYTSADSGNTWTSNNVPAKNWSVALSADGYKMVAVANPSGIWTSQTTPTPNLDIARTTSNNLRMSWVIPSAHFALQQSSDLTIGNWTDVTNPPVFNLKNLNDEVKLPMNNDGGFYRLISQHIGAQPIPPSPHRISNGG